MNNLNGDIKNRKRRRQDIRELINKKEDELEILNVIIDRKIGVLENMSSVPELDLGTSLSIRGKTYTVTFSNCETISDIHNLADEIRALERSIEDLYKKMRLLKQKVKNFTFNNVHYKKS